MSAGKKPSELKLVLKFRKLVEDGNHDSLLREKPDGVYAKLAKTQEAIEAQEDENVNQPASLLAQAPDDKPKAYPDLDDMANFDSAKPKPDDKDLTMGKPLDINGDGGLSDNLMPPLDSKPELKQTQSQMQRE